MTKNDQSLPSLGPVPSGWADPAVAAAPAPAVRRRGPLVLWAGCLVGALVLLRWLGGEALAGPSVTTPGAWVTWATTGDPLTVFMTILRLLALGLAWYLTGVTSISVVARALRAARLVRVADALSFGPVRVLAQQAVGVGLAAGVVITSVPGAPAPRGDGTAAVDVAVMLPVDEPAAAAPAGLALREPLQAPVPAPTTGSPAVPPAPTAGSTATSAETAGPTLEPTAGAPAQTAATPAPTEAPHEQGGTSHDYRVAPGDHFWSIAEDAVARHRGRTGSEAEVRAYWETLVAANADRLVVPGNPDLLLPGQPLLLPEVAA